MPSFLRIFIKKRELLLFFCIFCTFCTLIFGHSAHFLKTNPHFWPKNPHPCPQKSKILPQNSLFPTILLQNRLTKVEHTLSGILSKYTYTLAADGMRTGVDERQKHPGDTTEYHSITYDYDNLNRLIYESTNILDGDLTPLKKLPKFKDTSFQGRKHYNLRRIDFGQDYPTNLEELIKKNRGKFSSSLHSILNI